MRRRQRGSAAKLEKTFETTTMQLAQLVRLIVDADALGESTALHRAVSGTPPFFSDAANKRDVIRTVLSLYLSFINEPIQKADVGPDAREPQITPAERLVGRGGRRDASFLARQAFRSLHQGH